MEIEVPFLVGLVHGGRWPRDPSIHRLADLRNGFASLIDAAIEDATEAFGLFGKIE